MITTIIASIISVNISILIICLLVQPDGFVINPDKWDNQFFEYDYIGAPWEQVPHSYLDPWGKPHRVGNGGFSFRSKKLLDVS